MIFSRKLVSAALLCGAAAGTLARADMKTRTRYTTDGRATETTIYQQKERQRFETGQDQAMILQPDRQQMLQLDLKARTYMAIAMANRTVSGGETASAPASPAGEKKSKGGVVTYRTQITDTGERKTMFGMQARHIKSRMVTEPSPDACQAKPMNMDTDGWYVDLPPAVATVSAQNGGMGTGNAAGGCEDQVRTEQTGTGKLGYPLAYTMTMESEGKTTVMKMEVMEFSSAALDAALFDAPAGFTEAGRGANPTGAQSGSTAGSADPNAPQVAKRAGVVRVGVPMVNNKSASQLVPSSLRDQLVAAFASTGVEAVPLVALAENAQAAAQQAQCDYYLPTEVMETKKTAAGRFGGLVKKVSGGDGEPQEAQVSFQLIPVKGGAPRLSSTASAKSGSGLNWRQAVSMATTVSTFAASRFMLNPAMMQAFAAQGGAARSPLALFDPGMTGMLTLLSHTEKPAPTVGLAGPSESSAVVSALQQEAKAVAAELQQAKGF